MVAVKPIIINPGDVLEFFLNLNAGTFSITSEKSGGHAKISNIEGKVLSPFIGLYYPNT